MTTDPRAAERARRYRARRRETEVAETISLPIILRELIDAVEKLRESVDNFGRRDVTVPPRDVTPRHAPLNGAGAGPRAENDAPTLPSGASGSVNVTRDAVTAFSLAARQSRIVERLRGVHSPQTVAAIADACDLGEASTIEALSTLREIGLAERVPGGRGERDRWQLHAVTPAPIDGQVGFDEAGMTL